MNKLKLEIDLSGIDFGDNKDKELPKPAEIVSTVCKNIMFSYAQNTRGLTGEERKQYYRICKALDNAIKNGLSEVELEDEDAGFLRKCKRECKMLPSDILGRVEELIDSMVREK